MWNVVVFAIFSTSILGWFGAIWRIMKPSEYREILAYFTPHKKLQKPLCSRQFFFLVLAPSFRKKVKMIPESKLSNYLKEGFEFFLPDDMATGEANTDNLVVDFISYRQSVESVAKSTGCNSDTRSHTSSRHSGHCSISDEVSSSQPWSASGSYDTSRDRPTAHQSLTSYSTGGSRSGRSDEQNDDDASIHCDIYDNDSSIYDDDEHRGIADDVSVLTDGL
jgi:hypothetical protein